ncbi:MAG: sprD domain protein, partial [Psychroserpens sp.]|nr:sprD domain protein [Psychroserpens sp.]
QDRATLKTIKETTQVTGQDLTESDFDYGEAQSDNIQILKNVANTDDGYYVVLAVHNDVEKRNDFVRKAVASGESDID